MKDRNEDLVSDRMLKPVVLHISTGPSSFVKNDILILEESFSIRAFTFHPKNKALLPVVLIKEKLFLLRHILRSSLIICQFAGYQSLIPVIIAKIFKRACVIVVGGTDCVSMPSINYGNLRKPLLKWFTLKSLRYATHIVAPGQALIEAAYTFCNEDYPYQGYRYFDSSIATPCSIIHNGIDTDHFIRNQDINRNENSFLTICAMIDGRNFKLKGIDLFVEAARCFPGYEFTIIGSLAPGFTFKHPVNVRLMSFVENSLLPDVMSGHTFYCQLSRSEGFGVALAEAMSCGCIPIVSRVGIMDFIAGDSGFILDKCDPDMLRSVIETATASDKEYLSVKARVRITECFTLEERKTRLLALLNNFIQKRNS